MMKRTSLFLLVALSSSTAMAGDGSWTGWYVGLHGGMADLQSHQSVVLLDRWSVESQARRDHVTSNWDYLLDSGGGAYGLQFGYDHEFASGWLIGAEFDYSDVNASQRDMTPSLAFGPTNFGYRFIRSFEGNNQSSLRLKFGYSWGANMAYVTGGAVQVDVDATSGIISNLGYNKFAAVSETLDGSIWGVGWELRVGEHWSGRLEWLVSDVDDFTYTTAYMPGSTFTNPVYTEVVTQTVDDEMLRVAVNYRF